ncbi:hypothetical protein F5Y11DRAFT_362260 [Daldinia sp. FL1419]|nr:hypothetical protein F5Y11DRAFT_362260 [Daldinia sp. FL1419]
MPSFSSLPNEVVHAILIEAVQVRTVRRALRLRLVSRLWNYAAMFAIFRSGILDDPDLDGCPLICRQFWRQHLTDKSMGPEESLTRPLLIIRQVAARALADSGEDTSYQRLKDFVFKISQVCMNGYKGNESYQTWMTPRPGDFIMTTNISKDDEDYMQALLVVAAITNNVQLATHILPRFRESPDLVSMSRYYNQHNPVLGFPLHAAMFNGSYDVARILLAFIYQTDGFNGQQSIKAREVVVLYGTINNSIDMIELGLNLGHWDGYSETRLLEVMASTRSVETFEYFRGLYQHYTSNNQDRLIYDEGHYWDDNFLLDDHCMTQGKGQLDGNALRKLTVLLKFICRFAAVGEIPLIEHVLELCTQFGLSIQDLNNSQKFKLCSPIANSAMRGHMNTVAYLLEKGFKADGESVIGAALHGSVRMVRLLLDNIPQGVCNLKNAFISAVSDENEPVLRLLADFETNRDPEYWSFLLREAKKDGLDSIVTFLNNYS